MAASEKVTLAWEDTEPIAGKLRAAAAAEISGTPDVTAQLPEYMKKCFNADTAHEFEIFFAGTGAADFPASRYGKPGIRGNTCTLLNGKVLIDAGITSYRALKRFDADVAAIEEIWFTHSHDDHCFADALTALLAERKERNAQKVVLRGSRNVIGKIKDFLPETLAAQVDFICCAAFENFRYGKWSVVPVPANHATGFADEVCLHFIISGESKTLYYALDGGWICAGTWEYIRKCRFDMIIWDGTLEKSGDRRVFVHNDCRMVREMIRSLSVIGTVQPETVHILSHLSLEGWDHPVKAEAPLFAAADGMKIYL